MIAPETDIPVVRLDAVAIGGALVNIIVASRRLGHTSLRSTIEYIGTITEEQRFVCDALTMSTRDLIDEWFGGDAGAPMWESVLNEIVSARLHATGSDRDSASAEPRCCRVSASGPP